MAPFQLDVNKYHNWYRCEVCLCMRIVATHFYLLSKSTGLYPVPYLLTCLGAGPRVLVRGYWSSGAGPRTLVPRYWSFGAGLWVPVPGYRSLGTGPQMLVPGHWSQSASSRGCWSPDAWSPGTGPWSQGAGSRGCWSPSTDPPVPVHGSLVPGWFCGCQNPQVIGVNVGIRLRVPLRVVHLCVILHLWSNISWYK